MSKNSNLRNSNNISKIIGIQFSILSPDEIRNGSVAEITSRDTYINNKPQIGGLFDPRMGVLEPGLICPTDGLDYMETPGYFGHIELARPVFYIQYLSSILKILRCVCFKCSKLLISKEKYKQALKMASDARWKYVFSLASKMKRCGEDTENGCGCLQPNKIRKDGLATIFAEWKNGNTGDDEESQNLVVKLTAEMVLKIFKRISDEDVYFMGFSPVWSRPDWMICQVMAVPPPSVRPSVKHDSQQRSEDDLTHILVTIIKTNKTLQEKLQINAPTNVIDDWTTVLQYYVATQVDNKIPGVASVAQRSGRPLKSIKDRLNGKGGRMRGNLMAKRVDFSARSVITADPNISIRELGVPLKIAKNITKPVLVNNVNRSFLTKLVINGPDVYPGAKILEKKNGDSITLRYVDRNSVLLEDGDIVHRHMMNGDPILFNRQPTLHRMSMMCHIAKIMKQGDTFRMNVADTKPYNADFDGDEMNLHMPQDTEAEAELMNLAAVPYQIISPANNSSIIGIYQDSMLGCNRFTRENLYFTPRDAMNILMMFEKVNEYALLEKGNMISNFDILSQILPPLSLKYKTKLFTDNDDMRTSNNVLEIKNGQYIRGQMEKSVLGGGTKGLIQRICNDYGNMASANFIDDLQNIITEYMKTSAYSVGISDLMSDSKTNQKIIDIITDKKKEVKNLIDQTQLGIFENKTGKTNQEEFETQVNNILNQASSEAGKTGLKSLSKDNRFVIMVNAGSKGSELNISQMISCLGQQNVDGKRIPYGFDHRTLPHYTKYDDSPSSRGFVESSYINGLSPQELFFHAMGGRVGLIDTAVKTSTTGYIQRRLIKGLEDLMVSYDMTVRTNKNKIVQFVYGDDGIDPVKVENQQIPLVNMSIQDIYAHYNITEEIGKNKTLSTILLKQVVTRYKKQLEKTQEKCKLYTDMMIETRNSIIKNIFKNKGDNIVNCPVAFSYIINNIQGQHNINANSMCDLTPLEAYELIEETYDNLEKIRCAVPTELFKTLYFFYLSPKDLLFVKRFNRDALKVLLETISMSYKRAIVAPGEMVGMIAAQSIGEPTTQMSLQFCENIRCVKINKTTGNKNIVCQQIGELCDNIIERLPEYTFNTGHEDSVETLLEPLEDEYYIIGVDKEEKTHWNKISHISRHPVNGEMMKVVTKSGRVVETTTSHSHLIRDKETQTVIPITGADMKVGMRIPVAKHIDNTFIQDTIQIGDKGYKLDYLFGWFIGAYLAEGNLTKKTGTNEATGNINITNISPHFIENTKLFAERFDRVASYRSKKGEYGETAFENKVLADFIKETCGNGSFVKRIPDFAFIAPNEFKAGLIQAYMDGDGNFQCDKMHHQIRSCSRSKQLTKDMALLLNYFGIFASIKERLTRGSNIYELMISPKYSNLYQEHIGSLVHEEKLRELVSYVSREDAFSLREDIDNINGLGDIIAKCGKTLSLPGQSRNYGRWAKKETIGRRTLEKYIQIFETHPNASCITEELRVLKQASESYVIWDEISSIDIYTPDQKEYVYDFTVPANQTFMTDYGVIVHNTLNTFHFAGVSSKSNVTRGVPRIEEILSLSSEPKNPSLTVFMNPEDEEDREKAQSIMYMLEHTKMEEIVSCIEICFDPDDLNTLIDEDKVTMQQYKEFENMIEDCMDNNKQSTTNERSKWILRMELNPEIMLEKNITMDDVNFTLVNSYGEDIYCVYSDYNSDKLIFRIRMTKVRSNMKNSTNKISPLDQSDEIYILKNFQDQLLNNTIIRGIKNINKVILRKIKDNVVEKAGIFKKQDIWVLDTIGTNILDVLSLDYVDSKRTFSNDIIEIYNVLGIEAARQTIYNELAEVIEFDGTYINYHHMCMLCDRMTATSKLISIFRHGINNDNIGPIAKASFEETPEMFLKAARHAELDNLRGVSANVMCGQEGLFGTNCFQVVLDMDEMRKLDEIINVENPDTSEVIDKLFGDTDDPEIKCSKSKLIIQNNVSSVKNINFGVESNYTPF